MQTHRKIVGQNRHGKYTKETMTSTIGTEGNSTKPNEGRNDGNESNIASNETERTTSQVVDTMGIIRMPAAPQAVYSQHSISTCERTMAMESLGHEESHSIQTTTSTSSDYYLIEDCDVWDGICGFVIGVISGPILLCCLRRVGDWFSPRDKLTNGIIIGTVVQLLTLTIAATVFAVLSSIKN